MSAASELELRAARTADLEPIRAIESACFSDPWPKSAFASELGGELPMWVAVWRGEVAGYLCRFPGVDEWHISNVAVHPEYRRRGIGRRLIAWCVREAARAGLDWVYLEVRASNAAARALYDDLGFVEICRRRKYYIRPPEDGLVLGRRIWPADAPARPRSQG